MLLFHSIFLSQKDGSAFCLRGDSGSNDIPDKRLLVLIEGLVRDPYIESSVRGEPAVHEAYRIQKSAQIQHFCGELAVSAFFLNISEKSGKLTGKGIFHIGKFPAQQLLQVVLPDLGHMDDHETGCERFI